MSDLSVQTALRSDAPLVVIEAPAGCGKTTSGAEYARETALARSSSSPLILTHTHAACSVFADRTKGVGSGVQIRTIDSLIGSIAAAYHSGLGLPADVSAWVRQQDDGHSQLAVRVSALLSKYPMIVSSLAMRHRTIICDEHQDSSGDQHAIVMAFQQQGARLRIFGDPMQKIFRERRLHTTDALCDWDNLTRQAHSYEQLDHPHRWTTGCQELGRWTLAARQVLKSGGAIDLRGSLPSNIRVVYAENESRRHLEYQLSAQDREDIDQFVRRHRSLLVLTHHKDTARSLRSFFNRRLPLWEGHTRTGLENLVDALSSSQGDAAAVASAAVTFLGEVGRGFSPSAFGDRLEQEARTGCTNSCSGKPREIQTLAQLLVDEPNHVGVAKMLRRLSQMASNGGHFSAVKIDCYREFWEAICLENFSSAEDGFAEITHRRIYSRPKPPEKAISTIHKAKGLECESVIVMPCDLKTFSNTDYGRCLLYVALSRAKSNLMLVVSRSSPSPLLIV